MNLNKNIKLGVKVFSEFQNNFGKLASTTYETYINNFGKQIEKLNKDSFQYVVFMEPCSTINKNSNTLVTNVIEGMNKFNNKLKSTIDKMSIDEKFRIYENTITNLKNLVKKFKAGNCGMQEKIIQQKFLKQGIEARSVGFGIAEKKTNKNVFMGHQFVVIGMDKNVNIKDPKTWGENAVIIDTWSGIVGKASEVLEFFKRLVNFDAKKHNSGCMSMDHFNILDYLKYLKKG